MDERLNLAALELDAQQRELLVTSILTRATPELARRANADVSPIYVLYEWARPALAAAAVLALICTAILAQHEFVLQQPRAGLTEALNVPEPAIEWVATDRSPTLDDLLLAMETEVR